MINANFDKLEVSPLERVDIFLHYRDINPCLFAVPFEYVQENASFVVKREVNMALALY